MTAISAPARTSRRRPGLRTLIVVVTIASCAASAWVVAGWQSAAVTGLAAAVMVPRALRPSVSGLPSLADLGCGDFLTVDLHSARISRLMAGDSGRWRLCLNGRTSGSLFTHAGVTALPGRRDDLWLSLAPSCTSDLELLGTLQTWHAHRHRVSVQVLVRPTGAQLIVTTAILTGPDGTPLTLTADDDIPGDDISGDDIPDLPADDSR